MVWIFTGTFEHRYGLNLQICIFARLGCVSNDSSYSVLTWRILAWCYPLQEEGLQFCPKASKQCQNIDKSNVAYWNGCNRAAQRTTRLYKLKKRSFRLARDPSRQIQGTKMQCLLVKSLRFTPFKAHWKVWFLEYSTLHNFTSIHFYVYRSYNGLIILVFKRVTKQWKVPNSISYLHDMERWDFKLLLILLTLLLFVVVVAIVVSAAAAAVVAAAAAAVDDDDFDDDKVSRPVVVVVVVVVVVTAAAAVWARLWRFCSCCCCYYCCCGFFVTDHHAASTGNDLEVVLPRAVVSALLLLLLLEFVDVDHVVIVMSMSMHLTLLRLLSMLLLLPPMLLCWWCRM